MDKVKVKKAGRILFIMALIFGLSIVLCVCELYFNKSSFGMPLFRNYFTRKGILILNLLPILWLWLLVWFVSGRIWAGFFVSALLTGLLSLVNYFKLEFRNDPVLFEDLTLIAESLKIGGKYNIQFSRSMYVFIVGIIAATVLLAWHYRKPMFSWKIRVLGTLGCMLLFFWQFEKIYYSPEIYTLVRENSGLTNRWSATAGYVSRGGIYPFLYSAQNVGVREPEGYQKKTVKQMYDSYTYSDIPEDKKVNVISIMLEAYNDFSKFDGIEFQTDPYEYLHQLEQEAYSGELVTNIFAGGTVDTERSFLTGFTKLQNFRRNTRSYVHYFKEQGYVTEGNHPINGWFYNRQNVNEYLGFEKYHFFEDRYGKVCQDNNVSYANDALFFPDIIKDYETNRKTGKPYFNFSVTYQNHGPYSDQRGYPQEYLKWKKGYNESGFNIWNRYLAGIHSTNDAIKRMVDYFREESEPMVLIFFGDHNPWGGDGNSAYNMLSANFDLATEEGFYNYYCTPYIIWANEAAKEALGNDFSGDGGSFGPYFLMNRFFELAGWGGDEYMKITDELMRSGIDVVQASRYRENGVLTGSLSRKGEEVFRKFKNLEYYRMTNFSERLRE